MKIKQYKLFYSFLRLKKPFKHGSFTRKHNITFFIELMNEEGKKGYGEVLPRNYVTGEDKDTIYFNLRKYFKKLPNKFNSLDEISNFLYELEPEDSRNMASLCGLDMALLDLYAKTQDKGISQVLCEEKGYSQKNLKPRITSAVLGLDTALWKKDFYCFAGFNNIKLKISPDTESKKINKLYRGFFHPATLRLDGNCSLTSKQLIQLIEEVDVPISFVEQPFPRGVSSKIKGVKLLADESLVSLEDAKTIDFDAASIRIGKNGGFLRSLDIINQWEKREKPYMIGSLVGETSLLSAALLHLASITNPFLLEGCYSPILLIEEPIKKSISPSYKGKIKFNLSAPGLGNELDLSKVNYFEIEKI